MDYRISTITAIAKINSLIRLEKLFNFFEVDEKMKLYHNDLNNAKCFYPDILFIEYGKIKTESNSKGFNPKTKKKTYKKKLKNSKRFDNQLTIILSLNENLINMKLFKNGRVQMTGLKNIENGKIAIQKIIDIIIKINMNVNILFNEDDEEDDNDDNKIGKEEIDIFYDNFKICLINSDFKFISKLKRNKLFEYIINNTDLICSYEPCIYPGVKIQFFYNERNDGICKCKDVFCSNKNKDSKCIKITVAIFESGCTIITGAKSLDQINVTYNYIKNFLTNNVSHFKKIDLDELLLK